MIEKMERIEVVTLLPEMEEIVPFLQDQGVVHLEEVPLALDEHPGYLHRVHLPESRKAELRASEELDALLKEALPLLAGTPLPAEIGTAGRNLSRSTSDELARQIRQAHRTLRSNSRRRLNIQDNLEVLRNYKRLLENVAPLLNERNARLGETARALVLKGYAQEDIESLENRVIADAGPECGFIVRTLSRNEQVALITHPAGRGETVAQVLRTAGITPLDAPDSALKGLSAGEALAKVSSMVEAMQGDLDKLRAQLETYSHEHAAALHAAQRMVRDQLNQLQATEKFAQSHMVGVVHGWVPAAQYDRLVSAIKAQFGARAAVARLDQSEVDVTRIPTLLRNHPLLKPFEMLLKLFAPPTYGTIDPTPLVAVSFVLFYGFILGDAGYGLFILQIANWARKKWGHVEAVDNAMQIAWWMGASSIAFGIFFIEFFGDVPARLLALAGAIDDPHHMWYPIHRMHEGEVLLGIAVFAGVIHIPLSLILGIREAYRHHDHHHAEEKLGMLLGLGALAVALIGGQAGSNLLLTGALFIFLAAVYYLVRSLGAMFAMGVIEIIGLTANVLSYARLMALGIASVALADIANGLPDMLGLVIGIPMALAVHLLNIGIGVFSPTIHSLRLNYVEFLPKFYEPEGRSYEPFRKELVC